MPSSVEIEVLVISQLKPTDPTVTRALVFLHTAEIIFLMNHLQLFKNETFNGLNLVPQHLYHLQCSSSIPNSHWSFYEICNCLGNLFQNAAMETTQESEFMPSGI